MSAPRYARRLGWRTLKQVGTFPGDRRPNSFWQALARELAYAMHAQGITEPVTCAHFITQIAHETGGFRWLKEIWGPTTAQRNYDPASGSRVSRALGNTQKGDGQRFMGRGCIHITGRANYTRVSRALDADFVSKPHRLATRKWGARSAAWWWKDAGLNRVAVDGRGATVVAVTRVVNGGTNGLDDRLRRFKIAYEGRKYLTPDHRKP